MIRFYPINLMVKKIQFYIKIFSSSSIEQYEGFVRFTQDQLTRRFSELQFSCKYSIFIRKRKSFIKIYF
jgi:hypothetical protein